VFSCTGNKVGGTGVGATGGDGIATGGAIATGGGTFTVWSKPEGPLVASNSILLNKLIITLLESVEA
jgi:hypothetical protein